ncbi:hypothetical protein BDL97_13G101000 [Sphagnum fallax]|nr:hypothetical protein BDL97_13G101000 [Sphagnum fallax]
MWLFLPHSKSKARLLSLEQSKAILKEKIAFSCLEKRSLLCGGMDSTALLQKSALFLGMPHPLCIITHVGHPKKISSVFEWCFRFMNMLHSTREDLLCFTLRVISFKPTSYQLCRVPCI